MYLLTHVSSGSPCLDYGSIQRIELPSPRTGAMSAHGTEELIMNLTVEEFPSANSTGEPYVAGNFAPLKSEVTSFDLEVIGHVPEELTGRFLRIGPNPIDELDQVHLARHHWFAGTGMRSEEHTSEL